MAQVILGQMQLYEYEDALLDMEYKAIYFHQYDIDLARMPHLMA